MNRLDLTGWLSLLSAAGVIVALVSNLRGMRARDEQKAAEFRKKLDRVLLKNRDKGFLEAVTGDLVRDASNEIYFRKLANMGAHVARADRISRLLIQ